MDEFNYQLVLQLPGVTQQDFDVLLRLEQALADALHGMPHEVEGHDFGSGTSNIFIDTNDPLRAFALAKQVVNPKEHPMLKAAYRSFEEEDYKLIWPENSNDEFNVI